MRNCKPKIEVKLSSRQWAKIKKVAGIRLMTETEKVKSPEFIVYDPDGWDRSNWEESIKEKITEKEFMNRFMRSTVLAGKAENLKNFIGGGK